MSTSTASSRLVMEWLKCRPCPPIIVQNTSDTSQTPTETTVDIFENNPPERGVRMVYDDTLNRRLGQALLEDCDPTATLPPEVDALDAVCHIIADHPVEDLAALSSRMATMFFFPLAKASSAGMRFAEGRWKECASSRSGACCWRFVLTRTKHTLALVDLQMIRVATDPTDRAVQQDAEDEEDEYNTEEDEMPDADGQQAARPRAEAKVQELMLLCKEGEGLAVAFIEEDAATGEAVEKIRVVDEAGEVREEYQHWVHGVAQLFKSITKHKVERLALTSHENWIPIEVDEDRPWLLRVGDVVHREGASSDLDAVDLTPLQLGAALTTCRLTRPPCRRYRLVETKGPASRAAEEYDMELLDDAGGRDGGGDGRDSSVSESEGGSRLRGRKRNAEEMEGAGSRDPLRIDD